MSSRVGSCDASSASHATSSGRRPASLMPWRENQRSSSRNPTGVSPCGSTETSLSLARNVCRALSANPACSRFVRWVTATPVNPSSEAPAARSHASNKGMPLSTTAVGNRARTSARWRQRSMRNRAAVQSSVTSVGPTGAQEKIGCPGSAVVPASWASSRKSKTATAGIFAPRRRSATRACSCLTHEATLASAARTAKPARSDWTRRLTHQGVMAQ